MELGTLLLLVAYAYALGVFLYDLLPGRLPHQAWRTAAYPFAAMVLAEVLHVALGDFTPKFGGIHPFTALVAAIIGVLIDWLITTLRRPMAVASLETGSAPARP